MSQERGGPHNIGIIMEDTYDTIEAVALRTIREIWPRDIILKPYNKNSHMMVINTPRGPHEIYFLSATRPDKPRGVPKIGWAWCDEVARYEEDAIRNLVIGLVDEEAPLLLTTTPKYEVGSIWLKEMCDEALVHASIPGSDLDWFDRKFFINWSMHDNKHLTDRARQSMDNEFSGDWHAQEILGHFVEGGMLIFSKIAWPSYEWNDTNFSGMEFAMTVDPAFSERDIADRSQSSITVVGKPSGPDIYFIENPAGFWGIDELIDRMFAIQEKYGIRKMGIERVKVQAALFKLINERRRRENKAFQVIELPLINNANKVERAQVMIPYLKDGRYKFPKVNGRWTDDADMAIRQFKSFPLGRLNDVVDSNAHVFHKDMNLVEGYLPPDIKRPQKLACPIITTKEMALIQTNDDGSPRFYRNSRQRRNWMQN